jgi:hypothetical protein
MFKLKKLHFAQNISWNAKVQCGQLNRLMDTGLRPFPPKKTLSSNILCVCNIILQRASFCSVLLKLFTALKVTIQAKTDKKIYTLMWIFFNQTKVTKKPCQMKNLEFFAGRF